jgi:twinkle protein
MGGGKLMDIRNYLTSKGFEWKEITRPSGLNAVMNCPFCEDREKKFAINLNTGAFSCLHENNCGVKGSWYDFQKRLGDEPRPLDSKGLLSSGKGPKTYQTPKPGKFVMPTGEALQFLTNRGFTEDTIKRFKLAMTEDGKTIAMPFYKGTKLVNVKYRSISEKQMWQEKQAEPALFNRDNIPAESQGLVVTEGEFDTAALGQYGIDAVSVPSGVGNLEWIEHEWEWLNQFKEIILAFDMDDAGQEGARKTAKRLGEWRCKRAEFPFKDANDCLKNEVPRERIIELLGNAVDFTPAVLASADEFTEEVVALIENPGKLHGIPTAFEGLDDILGGWRGSELTIWSGMNSSGKSTILNQVIIDLVRRGIGCCVASLEMPAPRYLRWAVIQFLECQYPEAARVRTAMNILGKKFFVVNVHEEIDIKTLLDVFRYAARRYGCRHFVVDSLMRIKLNGDKELQEQKDICTNLVSFAKEYDAHVHLVAHPRKGNDDDDKPGKVDISGTAHITNLAHNVLIMWRPSEELKEKYREKKKTEDVPDARLYVKKNRELGQEGSIKLRFDPQTKRFR